MSKFLATFSQTYLSKVRAKSFMISTAIIVLLIFVGANFDKIINIFDSSEEITTLNVESDDAFYAQFEAVMEPIETDFDIATERRRDRRYRGAVKSGGHGTARCDA